MEWHSLCFLIEMVVGNDCMWNISDGKYCPLLIPLHLPHIVCMPNILYQTIFDNLWCSNMHCPSKRIHQLPMIYCTSCIGSMFYGNISQIHATLRRYIFSGIYNSRFLFYLQYRNRTNKRLKLIFITYLNNNIIMEGRRIF